MKNARIFQVSEKDDADADHSAAIIWEDLLIIDLETTATNLDVNLSAEYGRQEVGDDIQDPDVLASDESTWMNWTVFAPQDQRAKYAINIKANNDFQLLGA